MSASHPTSNYYHWCHPCCHSCHSEAMLPAQTDHLFSLWRKRSLPDQLPEMESGRKERHCHCHLQRGRGRNLVKSWDTISLFSLLAPPCFLCTYCLVSFVGECQNIWPLCGKLTRLIVVISFDILMFYLQINSLYLCPVIPSCLDLVCTHPSIMVTWLNPACEF